MGVNYENTKSGLVHRYVCLRQHLTYGVERCQQMAGAFLDAYVVEQVLGALAPAALELSVHAAEQVEQHRLEVDRIWRQRLERAELTCDRARRQYQLAEPENRLVVRQLEKDWEEALAAHQQLNEDYQHFVQARPVRLSAADLAAIRVLARDIPALWRAPTTTRTDRKRLLRCVVEQVQVTAQGTSEKNTRRPDLGRRQPEHRRPATPAGPPGPTLLLPLPGGTTAHPAGRGTDRERHRRPTRR